MAREPGKTLATARQFPIGQTNRTFKDSLDPTDRIDIWKFSTKLRSGLNLTLKGLKKTANVDVALLNANGRVLQSLKRRGKPINFNNRLNRK